MPPHDEETDDFESLEDDNEESLLKNYHDCSQKLFDAELQLAEHLAHKLKPYEAVYKRVQKHTSFRSAMFSLFLDPNDDCQLELFKYERDYEDV